MKVPEHNYETGQLDYREYPNEMFEPLILFLLTTSAWHEDPERVERRVRALKRDMLDYRNPPPTHHEDIEPGMEPMLPVSPEETLALRRRANLAKARAAKKAKRELQHA